MVIPSVSLPDAGKLIGALGSSPSMGWPWARTQGDRVTFYSQGRWGLVDAVHRLFGNGPPGDIWCPAYFCADVAAVLAEMPGTLRFYRVREDLQPDWEVLQSRKQGYRPSSVFILVHYFGFPNAVETARRFCADRKIGLIEDAAHVLIPGPGGIGSVGQMVVYSPRKLLPVPEGGILVALGEGAPELGVETFPASRGGSGRWILKRMTQKAFRHLAVCWYRFPMFLGEAQNSDGRMHSPREEKTGCGRYSRNLLGMMEQSLPEVVQRRRSNYLHIAQAIKYKEMVHPLFSALPEGVCPYFFPLRITDYRNRVRDFLKAKGIPAGTWPDLPSEVQCDPTFSMAQALQREILTLPVHQSLTLREVDRMAEAVNLAFRAVS